MATNTILPFAQAGTALVQSQAVYTSDNERTIGNQPGLARPDFVNKTLRQSSVIAAGIAQFLADNQTTNIDDTLLAAALSTIITNAIKQVTQTPAGVIVFVPGTVALPQTIKLNGPLLSRTTYARLWAYAQASGNVAASDAAWATATGMFSPGDGSTTFRPPDLRGYVFRAWDDGRGTDTGRQIGSMQTDQNQSHTHGVTDPSHVHPTGISDPSHSHTIQHTPDSANSGGGMSGNFPNGGATWQTDAAYTGINVVVYGAYTGISIQSQGGTEARMKNIALMPLIYY
jgi:microcystin-dependent protein